MSTAGPMERAVTAALKDAPLLPRDAAAVRLAKRYAEELDTFADAEVLADLGPKLLAILSALGMTPAGRGVKGGSPGVGPVAAALDEFTARRARKRAP